MSFLSGMDISASGLNANKKRLDVISSNLANAQTTRTAEGGPYRKKAVVLGAIPRSDSFSDTLASEMGNDVSKVDVVEVVSLNDPPILKYEPNHPDANESGYVAYPNINTMSEMANMVEASRNYEANISALNITKNMALKALDIGR